jgi:hypothetical protein
MLYTCKIPIFNGDKTAVSEKIAFAGKIKFENFADRRCQTPSQDLMKGAGFEVSDTCCRPAKKIKKVPDPGSRK